MCKLRASAEYEDKSFGFVVVELVLLTALLVLPEIRCHSSSSMANLLPFTSLNGSNLKIRDETKKF